MSLKAETGRILTVLGRNGVGKSSLLRAIVGQHMIAAGSIRWNDEDMTRLPSHLRARAGFGYVPQGREIFPLLTVRENLMTGFAGLHAGRARDRRRDSSRSSPFSPTCSAGAAAISPAASSSSSPSPARW